MRTTLRLDRKMAAAKRYWTKGEAAAMATLAARPEFEEVPFRLTWGRSVVGHSTAPIFVLPDVRPY